jgi:L-seryl-tRNA(Ser) seleniumtransferase
MRGYKVGKEEAMGMLMAVEMWVKRDHEAEFKQWTAWLDHIAKRVSAVEGVTTSVVQPVGLSNRMPTLRILWDRERLGLTGDGVVRTLFEGEPRVGLFPARGEDPKQTGVRVGPYMMSPGDEKIVAERLFSVLSGAPRPTAPAPAVVPAADLSGSWDVQVEYAAGTSRHTVHLRQRGNELDGTHVGDFVSRDLAGTIDGDNVRFRSAIGESSGDALNYTFTGKLVGEEMSGALDMGEYLGGRWTARRRAARGRG